LGNKGGGLRLIDRISINRSQLVVVVLKVLHMGKVN
jgi:hypothetical protein